MKFNKLKVIFLVFIVVTGVVMTSGCFKPDNNGTNPDGLDDIPEEDNQTSQNQTQQNNSQVTDENKQTTTQKSTPTSTAQKSTTPTTTKTTTKAPSTKKTCIHSWVQQYAGYDSSTGKIKYKIYCSKCGEVANYVWY